jgi:hypothetical protein
MKRAQLGCHEHPALTEALRALELEKRSPTEDDAPAQAARRPRPPLDGQSSLWEFLDELPHNASNATDGHRVARMDTVTLAVETVERVAVAQQLHETGAAEPAHNAARGGGKEHVMNGYLAKFLGLVMEHCDYAATHHYRAVPGPDDAEYIPRVPSHAFVLKGATDEQLVFAGIEWRAPDPPDQPQVVARFEAYVTVEDGPSEDYALRGWALLATGAWIVDDTELLDPIETLEAEIARLGVQA